jgi:hypothetical protein
VQEFLADSLLVINLLVINRNRFTVDFFLFSSADSLLDEFFFRSFLAIGLVADDEDGDDDRGGGWRGNS